MLCSFIGVGFVSGAEIYEFFVRFGKLSFLGIILFFVLCFLLSFKILKFQINNNFSFENKIKINDKIKSNKLLKMSKNDLIKNKITFLNKNSLKNFIVFLNVYFISATMFSGLNNLISNLFNHNFFLILILSFFVTFIFVLIGVKGLEKLDIFVVLFVAIITTFFVSNKSFDLKTIFNFENNILSEKNILALNKILFFGESLFFASLYVFMNILQFEPIVARSGINFSKKSAFFFSLMFALTLSVLLFIFVTFLSAKPELFESQMPFFTYFVSIGGVVSIFF